MKNNSGKDSFYKPEFVRDLFDKMSGSYERMNYITSFGFSIRWRKQSVSWFPSAEEKVKILDLMCGMGETWSFLRRKFPNAEIDALDFSPEMLKFAEARNKNKFDNKIRIIEEDFLKNTLKSEHYDYVVCAYGLKTFDEEQIQFLAKETARVLKTGGKFSFVEVSKPKFPILLLTFGFYLENIIPVLGKIFLGNPEQYQMLWKYTERFGNVEKVLPIFADHFSLVATMNHFGGCATTILGFKNNN